MKHQGQDKYYLNKAVKARRSIMPGIKDLVWAALRQTETPFTGPWSHQTIRRQISLFEAGKDTARLTQDLLAADEDHRWRLCHIDTDLLDDESESIFDAEDVEIVEYNDDSFYDVRQYWEDTHIA